jgi:hypothetical protein
LPGISTNRQLEVNKAERVFVVECRSAYLTLVWGPVLIGDEDGKQEVSRVADYNITDVLGFFFLQRGMLAHQNIAPALAGWFQSERHRDETGKTFFL